MPRVCYIYHLAYHYRKPFNQKLRQKLEEMGIEYDVIYSDPYGDDKKRDDTVEYSWGHKTKLTQLPFGVKYQHALSLAKNYDLVIVQQENKMAILYLVIIMSKLGFFKSAYFGHGRNFQARNPNSLGERWKRFWATKVDWWFAYTDETRRHVEALNFPAERITVFNNSVDTSELTDQIKQVGPERLDELRSELGLVGKHVGVFVGSLYPDKRLEFLVEAGDVIRAQVTDFEMLFIGGGQDLPIIKKLAASRPWIHVLGPRFGLAKVELLLLGQVFLMPGLVGLAILDAGAARLPIATTRFPWHSPEIAYLNPGKNGLMIDEWECPIAYGNAVAGLILDPSRLNAMSEAAEAASRQFSIEAMVEKFAQGVRRALDK